MSRLTLVHSRTPWTDGRRARMAREVRRALVCTNAVWERDGIDAATAVLHDHWARIDSRFEGWLPEAEAMGLLS